MPDKQSFRECSNEGVQVSSIAAEAQQMVLRAAGDTAGLTIKGQLRKAARALGYSDGSWRIRAAWYGEAETWSAKAMRDLEARYRVWDERQARLAEAADQKLAALQKAGFGDRDAEFRQARVERIASHAREAASRRRGMEV